MLAANKALPFNHLILDGDLTEASWLKGQAVPVDKSAFVGRYASGGIAARQLVRARELNSQPIVTPDKNAIVVVGSAKAADVRAGLNAGIEAKLCIGQGSPHAVKTVAVICAPGVTEPCSAIAHVNSKLAATLAPDLVKGPVAILPAQTKTCN